MNSIAVYPLVSFQYRNVILWKRKDSNPALRLLDAIVVYRENKLQKYNSRTELDSSDEETDSACTILDGI